MRYYKDIIVKIKDKDGKTGHTNMDQLLKNSRIVSPPNLVKDKNNCLSSWRDELQNASDKIKFDKCQEKRELGILCDAYPTCEGCDFQLPDETYIKFGGKLNQMGVQEQQKGGKA